ncbi:putative L,D-transpeptidase YnhG [Geobacteraceae bacterium]|nr:putative L,D-transpeptidase YnhG [Geobacteraceae bacterium]
MDLSGKTVQKVSLLFRGGARMGGAVSFLAAAVIFTGCSSTSKAKNRALAELSSLRQRPVAGVERKDYWSIEETVARAESHLARGERKRAEALFEQAAGRAKRLSERMNKAPAQKNEALSSPTPVPERSTGAGKQLPPAAASSASGLPHHAPERPQAPQSPHRHPEISVPVPEKSMEQLQLPAGGRDAIERVVREEESAAAPGIAQPGYPGIIGEKFSYSVGKGESLRYIGAKFGVSWRWLAELNRIDPKRSLKAGQVLQIDTRRIVPRQIGDGIVINIPDRTLYHFRNGEVDRMFAVAVGKPKPPNNPEKRAWHTPTGSFRIVGKVKDPTWRVPLSIQKEMEEQGKEVKTVVPPGAKNPLGKFALKTSIPGILIHSTNIPESVYGFSSHGCIRVFPEFMEELFNAVTEDTTGEIVYEPVKISVLDGGRIFLEVHRDIYNRYENLDDQVKTIVQEHRVEDRIDWNKVRQVLKRLKGIPEDITL